MGLDISAYSKINKTENLDEATIFVYRGEYHNDQAKDIEQGTYVEDKESERLGFRAGSYSGYNVFRNLLSEIILGADARTVWTEEEKYAGKPFYELINFSDCEGNFGPQVSTKLHKDFADHREVFCEGVKNKNPYEGYYESVYDNFMNGFELASQGGILSFH
jgi:hypothetical protein